MNENKNCESCKYFMRHYTKFRKHYIETICGHCIYPRLKDRKTDSPACIHYKILPKKEQEI